MNEEDIGLETAGVSEDSPTSESVESEQTDLEPSSESKPTDVQSSAQSQESTPEIEAIKTVPVDTMLKRVARAKEQAKSYREELESYRVKAAKQEAVIAALKARFDEERQARASGVEYDERDVALRDMQTRRQIEDQWRQQDAAQQTRLQEIAQEHEYALAEQNLQLEFDSALDKYGSLVSQADIVAEMNNLMARGRAVPHASLVAKQLFDARIASTKRHLGIKDDPPKTKQQPKQPRQAPPVGGVKRSPLGYALDASGFEARLSELIAAKGR